MLEIIFFSHILLERMSGAVENELKPLVMIDKKVEPGLSRAEKKYYIAQHLVTPSKEKDDKK